MQYHPVTPLDMETRLKSSPPNNTPPLQSHRQDKIRVTVTPDGNIRGYLDDDKKTGVSEMQFTNPNNMSPTLTSANQLKIFVLHEYRQTTE